MKKNYLIQKIIVVIMVTIIWMIMIGYHLQNNQSIPPIQNGSGLVSSVSGCIVSQNTWTVRGQSMEPVIHSGDELDVLDNYYTCWGKPNRGDIIIFEDSATRWPYVKEIRALPWDHILINADGSMTIEWELLKNISGQLYKFTIHEQNFLSLYLQNWVLQNGAFFVFWENTGNSLDSRKIWWVNISSFISKVTGKNGGALR